MNARFVHKYSRLFNFFCCKELVLNILLIFLGIRV
jgi:hypothetical protein